jgi:hypothetical protein
MRRSTTGAARIKGMLPPHVSVPYRTGVIGGTTSDVGILELPDGAGHLALVAFVKNPALQGACRLNRLQEFVGDVEHSALMFSQPGADVTLSYGITADDPAPLQQHRCCTT